MVNFKINNIPMQAEEGMTILEAAKANGVEIPSLCYLKEINEIGACRVCCVEIEGENKLVPSCNNKVEEGMSIFTNSPRVKVARRRNLELLLSQHDTNCAVCVRNGKCRLQKLAKEQNIYDTYFKKDIPSKKQREWPSEFPLIRDAGKCIKCMRCVQVCDKIQSLNIWDLAGTGSRTRVDTSKNKMIAESDCSLCGQCIINCPVGALYGREDTMKVARALRDPNKTVVAQIAPAVRTAWAENAGLDPEKTSVNHLAAALKQLGFDYVYDTSFSADLTIMEEGSEFIQRLTSGDISEYPMFTSCCPGWVRFLKGQFPELTGRLSTAKSPQQMFGAVAKSYLAEALGKQPEEIVCVSIMPCTAKKAECDLPTMKTNGVQEVDFSLTTREIVRMIASDSISLDLIEPVEFDNILKDYTGAGVIFGATGGVMEAALRSAYYLVTKENPHPDAFKDVREHVRGENHWREATFDIQGTPVRVAVTSGLNNARELCKALINKEVAYDFVEVMACPGGCVNGGGQTIDINGSPNVEVRNRELYRLDNELDVRYSHENKDVLRLYETYLGEPCGHRAHELLHTDHFGWEMPSQKDK